MTNLLQTIRTRFRGSSQPQIAMQIEEFLHSLHLIVDLDQLLDNIAAKLIDIIKPETVAIILFEPITTRYDVKKVKGPHAELIASFNFDPADRLIRWLHVNQCPLDTLEQGEVLAFLSEREQQIIKQFDCGLIVPLIVINRLTGAIMISRPKPGGSYDEETRRLMMRLADQSALAIEHAMVMQFQEERLQRLFHSDKLSTIGELAAGMAHEIRNPLTAIRSTVQYVRKTLDGENQLLVDGVIEEVDRIDHIIKDLLSFSKSSVLSLSAVNVEDIIDQTLLLLDSEFRTHHIDVNRYGSDPVFSIFADADQLKQVFVNILLNSLQAMPDGGSISITTQEDSQAADSIAVIIKDTGPGIDPHHISKVFDPFYTTKHTGTGLGLSISYGIVNKHGGDIDIESNTTEPDRGTSITIRLPGSVL